MGFFACENMKTKTFKNTWVTLEKSHNVLHITALTTQPAQRQEKHTLLLNESIPRALKGKKLRLKNPMVLPSNF